MKSFKIPNSSDTDSRKILLIGDTGRVFSDANAVSAPPCEMYANMRDGIDAAVRNSFEAIAVVMGTAATKLSSALQSLRESNPDAKIILLAQMHEEPAAMKLVGPTSNGANMADDYLICPIHFSYLVSRISYLAGGRVGALRDTPVATSVSITVDDKTKVKIRQLEKLATEDDLTGLKNRRYIWEFSGQVIDRAKVSNERVTLLVFDIDNFKHYNDVYGHSAGDEILKQAAVLMRRCCRSHDVVGRIGGDEFAVVFWDNRQVKSTDSETERRSAMADPPKEAIFIAKRLKKELEKAELHLLGPGGKGVLTISGGLASFPRDGATIQQLFIQADEALLEAKRSGKNRIYLVGKQKNNIVDMDG